MKRIAIIITDNPDCTPFLKGDVVLIEEEVRYQEAYMVLGKTGGSWYVRQKNMTIISNKGRG